MDIYDFNDLFCKSDITNIISIFHYAGTAFETTSMFHYHVQEMCQHEARLLATVCRICRTKRQSQKGHGMKNTKGQMRATANTSPDSYSNNPDVENMHLTGTLFDRSSVIDHIYQSHVKIYYRCTLCQRAFAEKEAVYEHRVQAHNDGIRGGKGNC